ncbi:MAG: beta galactosidase jelly roll domain-containing protein, partial [Solirubrobacterales bacterium]|nr:beta galactosidase jelly roll domain-containing protein [Solirubrobacterales bacterium]
HLAAKARADGITVPIFHNDKSRNGFWVPTSSSVPGTVAGPVDLYGFDGYPGGTCNTDGTPGTPNAAPDWGIWGPGGAKGGASASPLTPGDVAEFGGGWFDYWGSVGTYPCMAAREGPGYERVFYETNIANRLTLENFYMTFGGTSWGWLPAPVVYTSYDYGAALDEARQIRPKATAMKEIGLFLRSVPQIAKLDPGPPIVPSSPAVKVYDDVNPDTGTHFYTAMHNPSSATSDDSFRFPLTTADGSYTVPQSGTLRIDGQDAKILVADYQLGGQHLVYSTSQIMTRLRQGGGDLVLLHDPAGEDGETVLRYRVQPTVRVLAGAVSSAWDPTTHDERLDYVHRGLIEVRITGGGARPALLLIADDDVAGSFWRQQTSAGPVLERGPYLVRGATADAGGLSLRGDTSMPTTLEVWAPRGVARLRWNGAPVAVRATTAGSLVTVARLPGPAPVRLPDLSNAVWRSARESPEADPSFDDSAWLSASKAHTNSTTPPPAGQPVLTADDYGFHHGDVWYRARYSGAGAAASVALRFGGGGAGMLQAWLDGRYLGQDVLGTGVSSPPTTGTATFTIPARLRTSGRHLLAVMVRDDSHNEDGGINDAQKEGRGLISVAFADAGAGAVNVHPGWKIQGNEGGEEITDAVRGAVNNGGLYGERAGWYLPGYPDHAWSSASLPAASAAPGTTWYRTSFRLDVPAVDDASLGLTIGNPSTPRFAADYRALIFVNGWNMGQYIANVGPQHTFVVPNGVLNPGGENTLAIAVTSNGGVGNGLERVALTNLGTVRGGVPLTLDDSPGYQLPVLRPSSPRPVAGIRWRGALADLALPADSYGASLRATIDWGDGQRSGVGVRGAGARRTVTASHTFARPGRYRVRLLLSDAYGRALLASASTVIAARP